MQKSSSISLLKETGMSAQQIHQIRNTIPKNTSNELTPKYGQAGIVTKQKRIYLKKQSTDEEVLELALATKETAERLNHIINQSVQDGRLVSEEEQRMLGFAADLMIKLNRASVFNFITYERMGREAEQRRLEALEARDRYRTINHG